MRQTAGFGNQGRLRGTLIAPVLSLGVAAFFSVFAVPPSGVEVRAEEGKTTLPVVPPERIFTFRIPGDPETLDWNRAHTPIETHLLMNMMEGLVAFDGGLNVVPALAESWKVSDDGRTYTFKLRKGVKWSDGVPLKAKDFVYSWKRLLTPTTAASYAYFLFDVEGAEFYNKGSLKDFASVGVQAVDDHTLKVKLARPVAHWIQIPTFWVTFPLREDIVEKHGNSWDKPGKMVTLGPFVLDSYDIDSKIVLRMNPNYYGKRGNVERVVALIVKDESTALTLYETGKLDFLTDLSTVDLKRLSGRSDLRTFPYLKVGYIGFAVDKFPVSNPKIRRAIGMAIDKSKIPQILHGGQQPATSFVPPRVIGHSPNLGLKFDPTVARSELRVAGFDPSRPIKVEMILPNWDKALTLAQFIQAELKKNLNLNVTLQPFDHKTFRSQLDLMAYQLLEGTWAADYPDADNFLSIFLSNAGNNRTGWKNEKFDEKVLQARYSMDRKKREKAYFEAQKLLIEQEAVVVPLFYEPNMGLVRSRVKGLELNPLNYLYLRKVQLGS